MARNAFARTITPSNEVWKMAQRLARKSSESVTKVFSRLIEEEFKRVFNKE